MLSDALARVQQAIPPLFPLRSQVAVNPFLGYSGTPVTVAAGEIENSVGSRVWMPREWFRDAQANGRVTPDDLSAALRKTGVRQTLTDLQRWLESTESGQPQPHTVAAFLDTRIDGADWVHWVATQLSQFLASYFDLNQATWPMPWRHLPLLEAWREFIASDITPDLVGLERLRSIAASLDESADQAIARLAGEIRPTHVPMETFLIREAASLLGWAGHIQYRVHENALRGRKDDTLLEFLAIRLAFDAALFESATSAAQRAEWLSMPSPSPRTSEDESAHVWQTACEIAYQRSLASGLQARRPLSPASKPRLQAVFCIDVRSERLRRHLETVDPTVSTHGFAGFFGMPVAVHDPALGEATARLPVLFAPKLAVHLEPRDASHLEASRERTRAWQGFQHSAASCFTYVESFGLGTLVSAFSRKKKPACHALAPQWGKTPLADRVALAAGALKGIGLTKDFAPIVLICGHGSTSVNNPQAAALECGACGGHAGDANARLAVALLNDPDVRLSLRADGISIPDSTTFIAGLHNTTTDEIELFDAENLGNHDTLVLELRQTFAAAAKLARGERDAQLGHEGNWNDRACDIAETRPEFGLANNAAILFAPRTLSRSANLHARVFLHDYDYSSDTDAAKLTFLLSAPGVVASWINLQYYGSRVDAERLGAGNKVLHNVCGGIGLIEGNAGDLRPGLSWQSLHDGEKFVHEPLRLTFAVAAPTAHILRALEQAPAASALVRNGWVHLLAIEPDQTRLLSETGEWIDLPQISG